MARQTGPIKVSGTIGDIVFYKTKSGYFIKRKPRFDAKRFATDPAFAIQRKTMAELSRNSKASKLIRQAFAIPLTQIEDSGIHNRLNKVMAKVTQGDKTNERGRRNPADGEITLLEGFDFNEKSPLRDLLPAFTASIDRKTGRMVIRISKFAGKKRFAIPPNATHFRLQATAAALNFGDNQYIHTATQSPDFPIKGALPGQFTLQLSLPPGNQHPLFLALSISFLGECNGGIMPLSSSIHNAMTLVKVCGL
ncbi:hypothetical protein AAHN97_16135 [Chitinophaga niabensis]|uniref:hypothetical protein n=1 Tax=Chitinophaga niabensis TaxID=536979 RepID=UPI0031BAABE8